MGVTDDTAAGTVLEGQLERITYTREDTGYTVARVRVSGYGEPLTVVGIIAAPTVGEHVRMIGQWVDHPRFGRQFQIHSCASKQPATVEGIERYLSSGLIPGIGPVNARRIVKRFGLQTLDIIADAPGRLAEIPGIGDKRIAGITAAWNTLKGMRDVMVFLRAHDVSTTFALRIVKRYGERADAVIRQNPYRLAEDIHGIGFKKADHIATSLGISADAPVRVRAGLIFVLSQAADDGHVCYPRERLTERAGELLGVSRELAETALLAAARDQEIVIEKVPPGGTPPLAAEAVFLARYHHCETTIASQLAALIRSPRAITVADSKQAIRWVSGRLRFKLSEGQQAAVRTALDHTVAVITGGPGTGKTTIIRAILEIFRRTGARVALGAPTGRAAKRLTEATGEAARTIHRLLEYSPQKGGFQRNRERPLAADVMIVDEASMLDTVLMHFLLKALPPGCVFVMVGDIHQLPSVGAGNVLGDIIASGRVTVARLTEIFRQAAQSRIVVNAHRINSGRMPVTGDADDPSDFYFIEQDDPAAALEVILKLVTERIPGRFGMDPVDDIQVVTPMHKGVVGATHLNRALQQALNPNAGGIVIGERRLCIGDKVMQVRNNYDKDVFNGDMGRIAAVDDAAKQITVVIDGRTVVYDGRDLDEITLAYAVSVHKAQGSEYPAVVIPLLTQHYIMLQRNLIYTAVTRGQRLVVLVGSRRAVKIGIGKSGVAARFTRLRERLQEAGLS